MNDVGTILGLDGGASFAEVGYGRVYQIHNGFQECGPVDPEAEALLRSVTLSRGTEH
jgi:hypothetical protein